MSYLSVTDADREEMLAAIGVASVDELFAQIPEGVRLGRRSTSSPPLSEAELVAHLEELAARNAHTGASSRSSARASTTTTSRRSSTRSSRAASS